MTTHNDDGRGVEAPPDAVGSGQRPLHGPAQLVVLHQPWPNPQTVTDPKQMRPILTGYEPGDPLTVAHRFHWPSACTASSLADLAEQAYRLCNDGAQPGWEADAAASYRAGRNRSMSVGDVIVVTFALAVRTLGFEQVPIPELTVPAGDSDEGHAPCGP